MPPKIEDIKILDNKVLGYLDGANGLKWYTIGNIHSEVINIHGYRQGIVEDFSISELYADSKTGAIITTR